MKKKPTNYQSGFTIIELLVVAAIIALLAGIILVVVSTARQKGEDAAMKETLHQLRNALELYHADNGNYPAPTAEFKLNSDGFVPDYLPALPNPNLDYFYDDSVCVPFGSCFNLDAVIKEQGGPNANRCWQDDTSSVGVHYCY